MTASQVLTTGAGAAVWSSPCLAASRQSATATGSGDQNIYTLAIPGGTLGSTFALLMRVKLRRTTGAGAVTCKPKYGGTALTSGGALNGPDYYIEALLWADGSTSAQRWDTRLFTGTGTLTRSASTAAIDSSAAANLTVDVLLATPSDVVTLDWVSVHILSP